MPIHGRSFWILAVGVGSIVGVAVGVFALALVHFHTTDRTAETIRLAGLRMELAVAMRDAVRKRGFSLAFVQTLDDYFARDAEQQRFHYNALAFTAARERLTALGADPEQERIIARFQVKARAARPRVDAIMAALVERPRAAENQGLVREAAALQAAMFDELNALVDHLKKAGRTQVEESTRANRRAYAAFVGLGGIAVIIVLVVGNGVVLRELGHRRTIAAEIAVREKAERTVRSLNASLERRVDERTEELRAANAEAARLSRRLVDALDTVPDGFSVIDADGRLELYNVKFLEFYPATAPSVRPGMPAEDLMRRIAVLGDVPVAAADVDGWVAHRLADLEKGDSDFIVRIADGRRLRVVDRRMTDGSVVSVRRDITETLVAQEAAEAANRAKTEFLSAMSHELRTPLNAIIGFSQLLQDDPDNPLVDEQLEAVNHIFEAGEYLSALIADILDFARIETGRMTVHMTDVPVLSVLEECRVMLRPLAKKYDVAIELDAPSMTEVSVRADVDRLRQVGLNLMSNAVKYNRPGGRVAVTGSAAGDGRFRVCVADTGLGIAEGNMDSLFEPFTRFGYEASTIEGTGIGLTLTRQLVDLMGGVIGAESELGAGSTFWVDFERT